MHEFLAVSLIALLSVATVQANEVSGDPGKSKQNAQDLELIYRLAERPIGIVKGDRCEIRGAVWGYGPRPGAKVAMVNVLTREKFTATTNAAGVFSISTPYPGVPVVYAEIMDEPVFVRNEMAKDFKVSEGGVVCDHRLTTASSKPSTYKETK